MEFKRLSRITVAVAIYIVISAAFMLQVRNWLFKFFGDFIMVNSFRLFFILIGLLAIRYAVRVRLSLFKIYTTAILFILAYLFALQQPYFSERTHVLTYGLLGYLTANDLIGKIRNWRFKNVILSLSFVSLISGLDEIFQGILPYRVCELRDFITNIISATLGIVLLFLLGK
jgi:hypothetical protein